MGGATIFPAFPFPLVLFFISLRQKSNKKDMGLGSYWVRKDDQTGEAKTLKPWEESVCNGDKFFPDPNQEGEDVPDSSVPSKE